MSNYEIIVPFLDQGLENLSTLKAGKGCWFMLIRNSYGTIRANKNPTALKINAIGFIIEVGGGFEPP
jgi:hypothetical protein